MLINWIKPNQDNYKLDYISCFEKPVGIIIENYHELYPNIFYMILKLTQSLNLKSDYIEYENTSMDLIQKILKIHLKLELKSVENINCLHEFIEENLNNQIPVLLPGNLKELFYAKHYKINDWPHLFIIKGYDNEKQVYSILDSYHNTNLDFSKYTNFYMEYSTAEKLYSSNIENFKRKEIWFIENPNESISIDISNILVYCLDKYINNAYIKCNNDINKYLYCQENIDFEDYYKELLQILKWKITFFSEVISIYKYIDVNTKNYNEFKHTIDTFKLNIQTYINAIYVNYYRNKKAAIDKYLNMILKEEILIVDFLKKIKGKVIKIKELKNTNIKIIAKNEIIENNDDSIIKKINKNEYIFKFNNGKVYDSWFLDNSPKVMLKKIDKNKKTIIQTKLNILKADKNSKFHAGIYIRTVTDELFFWGINCGRTLRLDLVGINENIFDVKKEINEVILKMEIYEKTFIISYKDINDFEFKDEKKIKGTNKIQEIGIGCKNWGSNDDFLLKFDDILINESK